jgi:hypothetical protein
MDGELSLPAHAGALLRSVFGAALRQGACTTGLPRCGDCPLLRACAYPAIFETPPQPTQFAQRFSQMPNPYVIEPPAGAVTLRQGEPWAFHMVLVGDATWQQLPLIVSAWQRALRSGLGQARVAGSLLAVDAVDGGGEANPVFDLAAKRLAGAQPLLDLHELVTRGGETPAALDLAIDTPLRLQHESKPLRPGDLTPRVFMTHLLRRISLMLEVHLGIQPLPSDVPALLAGADEVQHDAVQLRWLDQRRFSARQGQELPQGGVVGRWIWKGTLASLLPWLVLGQWLHVGKGATAGLGGYRVFALDAHGSNPAT